MNSSMQKAANLFTSHPQQKWYSADRTDFVIPWHGEFNWMASEIYPQQ